MGEVVYQGEGWFQLDLSGKGGDRVSSVAVSPDAGKASRLLCAAGFANGKIHLWRSMRDEYVSSAASKLTWHQSVVVCLCFSTDGAYLLSGSKDGELVMWDTRDGTKGTIGRHKAFVSCITMSPDALLMATGSGDKTVMVWSLTKDVKSPVRLVRHSSGQHHGFVKGIVFSPDSTILVSYGLDGRVVVYDGRTGDVRSMLEGHSGPITCAKFSSDGTKLLTGGHDRLAKLWDTSKWNTIFTLKGHEDKVTGCGFAVKGTSLVTTSLDGTAIVWDTSTGKYQTVLSSGDDSDVRAVIVLSSTTDQATLVTWAADGKLLVWRLSKAGGSGVGVGAVPSSVGVGRAKARSGDSTSGGFGGAECLITLGCVEGGTPGSNKMKELTCLASSTEGDVIASGDSDGVCHLWSVRKAFLESMVKTNVPLTDGGDTGQRNATAVSAVNAIANAPGVTSPNDVSVVRRTSGSTVIIHESAIPFVTENQNRKGNNTRAVSAGVPSTGEPIDFQKTSVPSLQLGNVNARNSNGTQPDRRLTFTPLSATTPDDGKQSSLARDKAQTIDVPVALTTDRTKLYARPSPSKPTKHTFCQKMCLAFGTCCGCLFKCKCCFEKGPSDELLTLPSPDAVADGGKSTEDEAAWMNAINRKLQRASLQYSYSARVLGDVELFMERYFDWMLTDGMYDGELLQLLHDFNHPFEREVAEKHLREYKRLLSERGCVTMRVLVGTLCRESHKLPEMTDEYSNLTVGLQLGPWLLEWTANEIVVPHRMTMANVVCALDVSDLPLKPSAFRLLSQRVCYWNKYMSFHSFAEYDNAAKTVKYGKGNMLAFARDMLSYLNIPVPWTPDGPISQYIVSLLSQGYRKRVFHKEICLHGHDVTFNVHTQLDEYVRTNDMSKVHTEKLRLVQAFDLAFELQGDVGHKQHCPFYRTHGLGSASMKTNVVLSKLGSPIMCTHALCYVGPRELDSSRPSTPRDGAYRHIDHSSGSASGLSGASFRRSTSPTPTDNSHVVQQPRGRRTPTLGVVPRDGTAIPTSSAASGAYHDQLTQGGVVGTSPRYRPTATSLSNESVLNAFRPHSDRHTSPVRRTYVEGSPRGVERAETVSTNVSPSRMSGVRHIASTRSGDRYISTNMLVDRSASPSRMSAVRHISPTRTGDRTTPPPRGSPRQFEQVQLSPRRSGDSLTPPNSQVVRTLNDTLDALSSRNPLQSHTFRR